MKTMHLVTDTNEQIAYLRSRIVGILIDACVSTFMQHEELILQGNFTGCLMNKIDSSILHAYQSCSDIAIKKIYKSSEVLEIELAGFQIMTVLLDRFIEAVCFPDKAYSELLLKRIPQQYEIDSHDSYYKLLSVLDFLSGMTDIYALDLYRKITGINLPVL